MKGLPMYCVVCGERLIVDSEGKAICKKCGTIYEKWIVDSFLMPLVMTGRIERNNLIINQLLSSANPVKSQMDPDDEKVKQMRLWNQRASSIFSINDSIACFVIPNGSCYKMEKNSNVVEQIDGWENIRAIKLLGNTIIGLKEDGTVLVEGSDPGVLKEFSKWYGIIDINVGDYTNSVCGLKFDGTAIVHSSALYQSDAWKRWKNISKIVVSKYGNSPRYTALRKDGTIINSNPRGDESGAIGSWSDIVDIVDEMDNIFSVDKYGNVRCSHYCQHGEDQCKKWTDIISVTVGFHNIFGLKYDGTVVSAGSNTQSEGDVREWTDIISVYAIYGASYGLRSDGTFAISGNNEFPGLANVKLFDNPDEMIPAVDSTKVAMIAEQLEKEAQERQRKLEQLEAEKMNLQKELTEASNQVFGKKRVKELEAQLSEINKKISQLNS